MATNYDIIIGKRISAFDAPHIFQFGSKVDALKVSVPHQEQQLVVQEIDWTIADLSPERLTYRADFRTAICSPKYSFGNSFLLLEITLSQLMKKSTEEWYEVFDHLDRTIDLTVRLNILNAFRTAINVSQGLFYAIFFKTDIQANFKFAAGATSTEAYFVKNLQNIDDSYLCIGEMVDNRPRPVNITSPTELFQKSPELVFYLSPYFYLCRSIGSNYDPASIAFNDKESALNVYDVPMDRAEIARGLSLKTDDIMQATIRNINFSLVGGRFIIKYDAYIQVKNAFHISGIPIPFTNNNYHIDIHAEMFYKIYINNGVIDAKEITDSRVYIWEKRADDAMAAEIEKMINSAVEKIADIFIRFILPIAIDLFFGLNPIAGAVLFAVCDVLANKLQEAGQEQKKKELVNEIKNIKGLAVHFEKIIPFKMTKQLLIKDLLITSGVQIAATLLRPDRPFLLQGETMVPGERIIAYNGSVYLLSLEFQTDGNLVIYEEKEGSNGIIYKEARWCSDNDRGYFTFNQKGSLVVLEKNGQLVMYNDAKEVLWQSSEETTYCNYLCVVLSGIIITKLSDENLVRVKKGDLRITYLSPTTVPNPRAPYYVVSNSRNRALR